MERENELYILLKWSNIFQKDKMFSVGTLNKSLSVIKCTVEVTILENILSDHIIW